MWFTFDVLMAIFCAFGLMAARDPVTFVPLLIGTTFWAGVVVCDLMVVLGLGSFDDLDT